MGLETATHVHNLIDTWPAGSDQRSTADDHIRVIKGALLRTFPLFAGAVSVSHGAINQLDGISVNVQSEFNRIFNAGASGTISGTVYFSRDSGMLGSLSMSEFARTSISETFHKAVVFEEKVTLKAGIGGGVVDLGTISSTLSLDPALGNYFCAVLAGTISAVVINAAISAGQILSIRLQQGAGGSKSVSGWPAGVVWADDSTFSARPTASLYQIITLLRDPLSVWFASHRKFGG